MPSIKRTLSPAVARLQSGLGELREDVVRTVRARARSPQGPDTFDAHVRTGDPAATGNRPGADRWGARPVDAHVELSQKSEWTVSPLIFGRFHENNGRKTYPGLYDQHVANTSFEDWVRGVTLQPDRDGLAYTDVPNHPGLARGWEPLGNTDHVTFARPAGGVHGDKYQRVINDGAGPAGISQRLPLPDHRTREFDVSFRARSAARGEVQVKLLDAQGDVVAQEAVHLSRTWGEHQVRLELSALSPSRFRGSAVQGDYRLVLETKGQKVTDFDMVQVVGADAVDGKFNPDTIERVREFGATSIRWPGGNTIGHMHWKDGVGPLEGRKAVPIYAWEGTEPNFMGMDEYLRFCELTGTEPMVNIGFNPRGEGPTRPITARDAAQLVEYLNGDVTTPMGRLRARNGHPEPYGVKYFQVGNEVFGKYQYGDATAEQYARGFVRYHDAMKAVDPDIEIIASGINPRLTQYGGNQWNDTLLRIAGDKAATIDIHPYFKGITDPTERASYTDVEYLTAIASYPADLESAFVRVKNTGKRHGVEDVDINVGEYNPGPLNHGTQAYAVYQTGMYNAFIRQGDAVRFAYQLDHTLYAGDNAGRINPETAALHATRLYAEPFEDGTQFHYVPVHVTGPRFDLPKMGERSFGKQGVPYIDSVGLVSADGQKTHVFMTNRNLGKQYPVRFAPPNARPGESVRVEMIRPTGSPLAAETSYAAPRTYVVEIREVRVDANGHVRVDLPPGAVARFDP